MKKFKYLYLMLLGIVCGLAFSACSYDDDDYDAPNFLVLNPELSFDGTGGTQTINVQADAQPTASVVEGADWCTVAYADNANGTYNFNVTVAASAVDKETTAIVRIIQGYSRKDVTITRAKKGEVVTPDEPGADMSKTAMDIAKLMYPGWNLGNTLEGGDSKNIWTNAGGLGAETSWQSTKTTQALIDAVKAAGFKSVRIPCAWVMGHITDKDKCTIDPEWTARVKEVVDYCIKDGLYVIINDHWDGGWIEHNGLTADTDVKATKDKLTKIWTQIANNFKAYDEHLLFAGMNEPGVGSGEGDIITVAEMSNRIAEYEQAFIEAVRATGGNNANRVLIVQGPNTNIDNFVANNYMSKIKDSATDRLMVEVHFYDPYQFTDMSEDQSWGKYQLYWGKNNTNGSVEGRTADAKYNEDYVEAQMKKMKTNFFDKGYPVLIGEFGANQRLAIGTDAVHDASVKDYYKAVVTSAINNGCIPVAWDTNGGLPSMTIFKRSNASVGNQNMLESIQAAVAAAKWPAK